eukprot:UN23598
MHTFYNSFITERLLLHLWVSYKKIMKFATVKSLPLSSVLWVGDRMLFTR